ncbi:MAG: glycoside hydrolase/phage tail family protein [Methylobacterium frigidaeris]
MSTLVLSYAGKAAGTALGGPLGGLVGGVAGTLAGGLLDRALFGARPKPRIDTGPRLADLYVTASSEGATMARVYGRSRVAGQILWATRLKEVQHVERVKTSGGKGMPAQPKTFDVTYSYSVSFAVALCEGPISGLGQVYADGTPIRLADFVHRVYLGGEDQGPDPKIEAVEGAGRVPAYRGLAYLVFEDLPLAAFGNRVPVITAEVIRRPPAAAGGPVLEDLVTAVTLIPAMGEFVYASEPVTASPGLGLLAGQNTVSGGNDLGKALDQLAAEAPNCRSVSLVVAWHGTDLRLDACRIVPKVERAAKTTSRAWQAGGLTRESAGVVSLAPDGSPAIGGAPADWSVVQAIVELKRRGFAVTLYPFVMMDIPAGNGLPDPHGGPEQAAFPWRGRVTCHPAPGRPGSPDKSPAAADAVAAFFGQTTAADLTWTGGTVASARPGEWSFRRFILTCARLAQAAGGVDGFLIGSEMVGLTALRSGPASFPAVDRLRTLAADARAILGPETKIGYGADWTEYASHRPADGSGDVLFHLDPLWADPGIDFVGIDNYLPLADWRDGFDHRDARAGAASTCDPAYLRGNVEGGELYDWYYAGLADRDAQVRTPIRDTAHGEHWVFRLKDLRGWWSNAHHDRPGGVRRSTPTAWVPGSKPVWFTELGCPAADKGANQPNVFVDPKSSESVLPYYSNGRQDLAVQRAYLEAVLGYWRDPARNPVSPLTGARMVEPGRVYVWTWDARPYPEFPLQRGVWADAANYHLGHWINGRLGLPSLAAVVADLCAGSGAAVDVSGLSGVVQGYAVTEVQSPRDALAPLRTAFFFDGAESAGRIVFRPLAGPVAARFSAEDLVAAEAGPDLTRTRGEETALPGVLALGYLDPTRAYQAAAVEARRLDGRAAAVSRVSLPLALDTGAARGLARALLYQAVTERESVTATLPPSALALDPGDVVALDLGGVSTEYRLTRLGHERGRPASGVRVDAGVFAYRDGTPEARVPVPPATAGVALFEVLDLPLLRGSAVAHAPYLAAYTAPWSPVAVQRALGGEAFEDDAQLGARSIVGRLTAPLHRGPAGRWDRVNTVFVEVPAGAELVAASDGAVLNGANAAALRTPSGEWEVLQWAGAVLEAPGRYRLSRLLRGQLGTEAVMADAVPAGAAFVVLSEALVQSAVPLAARTLPQVLRWGPLGTPPDAPSWRSAPVTVRGVGLRPYAPAQARARRLGNGDLALSWVRRTRFDGDAWDGVEVPVNEEREAYELDVLAGDGRVLRTLASAAPAVTYTAAMQAADHGGPVAAVSLAIVQLSTSWGRGAALRTTLYL